MGNTVNANAALSMLRPVETKRASEAIYEQIKELIVSGQLQPGDRLPSERSMMDMLQRCRPTIREALRMLERSGFIRTMPGTNGAIVQEPSTFEVEQSLEVMLQTSKVSLEALAEYRSHNDTAVARWAAQRHTPEDLSALDSVLKEGKRLIEAGDLSGFVHLDAAFHGLLAKAGKNEVAYILTQVMSNLSEPKMLEALRRQGDAENRDMCLRILSMHKNIYEAVRLDDADAAAEAMAYHIHTFSMDLHEPSPVSLTGEHKEPVFTKA